MRSHMVRCSGTALGVVLGVAVSARADMLQLSDVSSDETPASVLDALLTFSVTGDVLTLTVTNETSAPSEFNINQVYFNATDNVTGLTLDPDVPGWRLFTEEKAGKLGTHDFALIGPVGNGDPDLIVPLESVDFVFDITGLGPFSDSDFTTEFSEIPTGDTPTLAAAKFVNGPGDDSALGGVVPVPGAALLAVFGLGLFGVVRWHLPSQ